MSDTRVLLHVCCGPCACGLVPELRDSMGLDPVCYFHNPNIHPLSEYRRRLEAARDYAAGEGIELVLDDLRDPYPLEENLALLLGAPNRCAACFEERLDATAEMAARLGIGLFTTTLLISPYQNPDLIESAGRSASRRHGCEFLMRDFTPLYRESISRSRRLGLYRQKYCGCVMSERDRIMKIRSPGTREKKG